MSPEEGSPSLRPMPDGAVLALWVIYDHPADFPHGYVLRCQWAMRGGTTVVDKVAWYADDPEKLRAIVPAGLFPMRHQPGDDPVILEMWI